MIYVLIFLLIPVLLLLCDTSDNRGYYECGEKWGGSHIDCKCRR